MIKNKDSRFKSITELLKNNVNKIEELYFTGDQTGLADFTDSIAGIQPGELFLISGNSSIGTSSFVINVVGNLATNMEIGVAIFSMNMSAESMIFRMMSSQGKINVKKLCRGQLEEDEWPRLTEAVFKLNKTNIFIDDTSALSPHDIQARLRGLTLENSIGLVVIDSFHLIQLNRHSEKTPHDISIISNEFKAMAKEMNISIIALSDINS